MDAFDVVSAVLPARVSTSALGQLRLLLEDMCLIRWLVDPADGRQTRACRLALAEIRDASNLWSRVTLEGTVPPETLTLATRAKKNLSTMTSDLKGFARDQKVELHQGPPDTRTLFDKYELDYVTYKILSDSGSHPGLSVAITTFNEPGQHRMNVDLAGSLPHRAYHLAAAYPAYATICDLVTWARGWHELQHRVREHHQAHLGLLAEAEASWAQHWQERSRLDEPT